jgi:hypothetical protein
VFREFAVNPKQIGQARKQREISSERTDSGAKSHRAVANWTLYNQYIYCQWFPFLIGIYMSNLIVLTRVTRTSTLFEAFSRAADARRTSCHHVIDLVGAASADLDGATLVLASFLSKNKC